MPKYNYFEALEQLSILASRAVFLSCSPQKRAFSNEMENIKSTAYRSLCELETILFSDFMPPLDRAGLSVCAHALCRVIEKSSELFSYKKNDNSFRERKNKEAEICIRLAGIIEKSVSALRRIKRPEQLPDLVGFRKLLCDAEHAHSTAQKNLGSGTYRYSSQCALCLLGQLRRELSLAFDELVEIMLECI